MTTMTWSILVKVPFPIQGLFHCPKFQLPVSYMHIDTKQIRESVSHWFHSHVGWKPQKTKSCCSNKPARSYSSGCDKDNFTKEILVGCNTKSTSHALMKSLSMPCVNNCWHRCPGIRIAGQRVGRSPARCRDRKSLFGRARRLIPTPVTCHLQYHPNSQGFLSGYLKDTCFYLFV